MGAAKSGLCTSICAETCMHTLAARPAEVSKEKAKCAMNC